LIIPTKVSAQLNFISFSLRRYFEEEWREEERTARIEDRIDFFLFIEIQLSIMPKARVFFSCLKINFLTVLVTLPYFREITLFWREEKKDIYSLVSSFNEKKSSFK